MPPEGRLLQSAPWTKGLQVYLKSRGKDNVRSDLEKKLFFEDVFREKVIAKYESYKNFVSQSRFEFLKDF